MSSEINENEKKNKKKKHMIYEASINLYKCEFLAFQSRADRDEYIDIVEKNVADRLGSVFYIILLLSLNHIFRLVFITKSYQRSVHKNVQNEYCLLWYVEYMQHKILLLYF